MFHLEWSEEIQLGKRVEDLYRGVTWRRLKTVEGYMWPFHCIYESLEWPEGDFSGYGSTFCYCFKNFRDLSVLAVHVLTGLYTTQQKKVLNIQTSFSAVHFLAPKTFFHTSLTKRSMPSLTREKDSMKDCGRLRTTQKWSLLHPRYILLFSFLFCLLQNLSQYLSCRHQGIGIEYTL